MQDGVVLVLELLKKNPKADKEWIYKALHNLYATKAKKLRRYEYRRVDESRLPEHMDTEEEQEIEELEDIDLEIVAYLLKQGIAKDEIAKHLGLPIRTLYAKISRRKDA